jgi:hypothetical protein
MTQPNRRYKRNGQITRQWRILKTMNDCQWWSLSEIMDAAGIADRHKRTIMRDMEALMEIFAINRRQGDRWYQFEYRLRHPLFLKTKG